MNELHLFAGAGGGILGGLLLGHRPVCAVEIEEYPRKVLLQRQRDGVLPRFPIWDDIRTFDGEPWRGRVDVVCGGFPCQDISSCGRGAGIEGEKSSLWQEMSRVIGEIRPTYVFVENSQLLIKRGLALVISDLAKMGYYCRWGVVGADAVGFPHHRARLWLVANTKGAGLLRTNELENSKKDCGKRWRSHFAEVLDIPVKQPRETPCFLDSEPALLGKFNGLANRVDRLKAAGNGQVPQVAKLAWELLKANTENVSSSDDSDG